MARRAAAVAWVCFAASAACAGPPTTSDLDRDNPIRPLAAAPFGLEEFFAEDGVVPDPLLARLGRWLFFDTRLSADDTVSCASCHRPEFAFSEPRAASIGVGGQRGHRKAPSLINLGARTVLVDTPPLERSHQLFWDGRVTGLEAQVLQPIANPIEMGLNDDALVQRLGRIAGYRPFFREAFGSDAVTPTRVGAALADFVRTLRAGDSAYDRWVYGRDASGMSAAAQRGSDLFFFTARCAVCHAGFNFSDARFHNLGVGWTPATRTFRDAGRIAVTGVARDRGAFKTPALRDVSRHAPYMHDGSLATLRDVVEFYNRGGIDNPWRSGRIGPLGLSPADVDDLVAFLRTLDSRATPMQAPHLFPQ